MAKSKKWELSMNEQRELRKQGAELLHQRVTLLVACYDDMVFRRWCEDGGKNDIDVLDEELSDVAINFLTAKAVLDAFPDAETWRVRNVRHMIAEVIESSRKSATTGERISWKDRCLAAEKECERLRGELASRDKTLEILQGVRAA